MKTIISRFLILLLVPIFAGCVDLNTSPMGSLKTMDQKNTGIKNDPSLLNADVAACYSVMTQFAGASGDEDMHTDFGFASLCITMDCNGQDMTCENSGYNWYGPNFDFSDRLYTNTRTKMTWTLFYNQIRAANSVLLSAPKGNESVSNYRGQALAVRAFDYLCLAQLYQFTYKGNETKPCVPIVTETTNASDPNPRATVQEVYKLVIDDLTEAIGLLDNDRIDKGYINRAVAYGLRARANLVMGNWAEAAADAKSALDESGATPYTLAEVSKPTFTSADANSVLWANIITEDNDIVKTGIVNWPSHLCSFFSSGYVSVGVYKRISECLYKQIANTDVRKGWWLNEDFNSPLLNSAIYKEWKEKKAENCGYLGNVKFGIYNDQMTSQKPASDWILMRAEEMLLIQAEGLAMSGNVAGAKTLLENFVKTYRDPSYTCQAADAKGLQDEIWLQRRIELWGEGFSFFDIMRLRKSIERVDADGNSSYPDDWRFNINAEDPILLWLIPQSEIEANDGISEEDNNARVNPPTPL